MDNKRRKRDMGRNEWRRFSKGKGRNDGPWKDRRGKEPVATDADAQKPADAPEFAQGEGEVESEARRPKRKVAVMIGYTGTGYHGMQINAAAKTIEGDLFKAFVAAGAISKANSNDPKKSSLVRCARTDKGVHAAGNVISLKLIIEDPEVVHKINEHLPKQIRVWGMERTNGSFSAYQQCDSRIYEYLIPSHTMLPPHPRSFLGQKLERLAEEAGDVEGFRQRQTDALHFWDDAEAKYIKPVMETLPPSVQEAAMSIVHGAKSVSELGFRAAAKPEVTEMDPAEPETETPLDSAKAINLAVCRLKNAYLEAKRSYRIPLSRLDRLREVLSAYHGTHNYHNYTIHKDFREDNAKRHIKSFVADDPIVIGETEWLSLKVHGQSFMMHQIRKMVSMAALVVRTGCALERVKETYASTKVTLPKAPGLGLLLERPVFDHYNERAVETFQRKPIDFNEYRAEIDEFKRKMIYEHIFQEEETSQQFVNFFGQIDSLASDQLLYLSSAGFGAVSRRSASDKDKSSSSIMDGVLKAIEGAAKEEDDAGIDEDQLDDARSLVEQGIMEEEAAHEQGESAKHVDAVAPSNEKEHAKVDPGNSEAMDHEMAKPV